MEGAPLFGRWTRLAITLASVLAVCTVIFPLIFVIRVALRPEAEYLGDPTGLLGGVTLENFALAWQNGIGRGIVNSLIVILPACIIASTLSTLAGYGLAKQAIPYKGVAQLVLASVMVLPLASLGMPIFEQALSWGYLDNQFGLSVVYGVLFSAWASFFMASYFSSLPDDLIEAAHIDGATKLDVFVRIAVPLAFPAIASTLVINLFVMWSELIIAIMFLPSAELQTVAATLAQFNEQRRSGGPVLAAAMLLDVLPVIIAFALAQRWLKAEVFGGGVKS